jgi:hypothetical protein
MSLDSSYEISGTKLLAMDDINEIVIIALRELIQNHPVSNNKQPSFNPKPFFAVSQLKDIDKQFEKMRNE